MTGTVGKIDFDLGACDLEMRHGIFLKLIAQHDPAEYGVRFQKIDIDASVAVARQQTGK